MTADPRPGVIHVGCRMKLVRWEARGASCGRIWTEYLVCQWASEYAEGGSERVFTSRTPIPDNPHSLPSIIIRSPRLPLRAVRNMSAKVPQAGNIRPPPVAEESRRGDEHVADIIENFPCSPRRARICPPHLQPPPPLALVELGVLHPVVQLHVVREVVLGHSALEVRVDLGAGRVVGGPVGVRLGERRVGCEFFFRSVPCSSFRPHAHARGLPEGETEWDWVRLTSNGNV